MSLVVQICSAEILPFNVFSLRQMPPLPYPFAQKTYPSAYAGSGQLATLFLHQSLLQSTSPVSGETHTIPPRVPVAIIETSLKVKGTHELYSGSALEFLL